mmetsp:Transcript_10516/g.13642  ORF Transcript_10516/g.13642 Transcript_10516/m.13642 type:complete len:158 (-) Transcript_10516:240-713(-)
MQAIVHETPLLCATLRRCCRIDESLPAQVVENTTKCLSLLFQIFGDVFLQMLFWDSKEAQQVEECGVSECFSEVLTAITAGNKVKLRILHLLWMASNSKDAYNHVMFNEPLWSALQHNCYSHNKVGNQEEESQHNESNQSLESLALDICHSVKSKIS